MTLELLCIRISQLATCITAWWMFHNALEDSADKEKLTFAGMAVYMLLPAHVNMAWNNRDWTQIMIWMLVPFAAVMLLRLKKATTWAGKIGYGIMAAGGIGIIGRKDGVAYLILLFLLVVAGICQKQWLYPLAGILGMVLAYPTFYVWKYWLFDGAFAESGLEYTSIMEQGYSIGGLFSTYFHRDGHPGMGILLIAVLLVPVYAAFVKKISVFNRKDAVLLGTAVLLTAMSLRYFPWDFVQRLGSWALGLVTLIQTPAVFFYYAQMVLCVWGVEKCGEVIAAMRRNEDDIIRNKRNEGNEVCDVEENRQDLAG